MWQPGGNPVPPRRYSLHYVRTYEQDTSTAQSRQVNGTHYRIGREGSGVAQPPHVISLPSVNTHPLVYKKGKTYPGQGHRHSHSQPALKHTHTHTCTQPRDLGPWLPLSPICDPYSRHLNTRARELELDIGTFRPNQYKILCIILVLPSVPVMCIINLLASDSEHRQLARQVGAFVRHAQQGFG